MKRGLLGLYLKVQFKLFLKTFKKLLKGNMVKRALLLAALVMSCSFMATKMAVAAFYPDKVHRLCERAQATKLVDNLVECSHAKLEVAEKYLKETYGNVLKQVPQNKVKEFSAEQKKWTNSLDIFCPYEAEEGPLGEYQYSQCVLDISIRRAFELEASILPRPEYPKPIEQKCSISNTFVEKIACEKEKLAFNNQNLKQIFKDTLANTVDKEALEQEQIQWSKEGNEVCVYDDKNGVIGNLTYLECLNNWTLIRLAKLLATGKER